MAEILPIRRKTISNHSINQSELTFKNLITKYYNSQENLQQRLTYLLMLTRHPFCNVDIRNLILNQPKLASYFGHFLNLTNHLFYQNLNKPRSDRSANIFRTRLLDELVLSQASADAQVTQANMPCIIFVMSVYIYLKQLL